VVELRAPVPVDKGTAVLALARRLGADVAGASLLFVGDDVTDEDAFLALRGHPADPLTVRVGDAAGGGAPPATAAASYVAGTEGVRRLLDLIAELRGC
jgi:trehalose-phosphatase